MPDTSLHAVSAFDGRIAPIGDAIPAGVTATERADLALATIMTRKGKAADLGSRLSERFGTELPSAGRRTEGPDIALVSTGPGAWLSCREQGGYEFAEELAETLTGIASVADQSDALAVLRLSGPRLRQVLAKGIHVDFHDTVFQVGHAAATQCAHVGVTLWRLPDDPRGDPVFEIAMFRSYAESFSHWLQVSAAEYGLAVTSDG